MIARKEEQRILQRIYDSRRSEFLAIYGRRRIGKTYLIRNFFKAKPCCFFQITGVKNGLMKDQLYEFTRVLEKTFYHPGTDLKEPNTWMRAFEMLTQAIEKYSAHQKIILFFDEIPWLASKRSRFLQALDYYWNTSWSTQSKICLIVCGSAASWVINNIINNKGGLHNRITAQIRLEPFSLNETQSFLKHLRLNLNNQQILQLYMVMGGVPHYLERLEKGISASQNIDNLCFNKEGLLFKEFDNLFSSLFDKSESYTELIRIIAQKRYGIERRELVALKKLSSGGTFNQNLKELEEAGFIISFKPYGHIKRGHYYRVIDEYVLFYLNWIEPIADSIRHLKKSHGYWEKKQAESAWKSWSGYAFEAVCYKHITEIREALHISVTAEVGAWRYFSKKGEKEKGAQVDLLFDRDDDVVTLCEIKYNESPFEINKQCANSLVNKMRVYKKHTKCEKQIFLSMITANGLKPTMYSEELISNQVTLNDLMAAK